MLSRRKFTNFLAVTPLSIPFSQSLLAQEENASEETVAAVQESATELPEELETSSLIYLTPIKSDGEESKCQAEVWFVYMDSKVYVTTADGAWRAEAINKDLTTARIWVGEYGPWQRANGKYKEAPQIDLKGSMVDLEDEEFVDSLLQAYSKKYVDEWPSWGPRFKKELDNGSRVVLSYEAE